MSSALAAVAALLVSASPDGLLRLDLRPGVDEEASDHARWNGAPRGYVQLGDTIYFTAFTAGEGDELHAVRPADGGARLVLDLAPGQPSSGPESLVALAGHLFFAAHDGERRRLFESDGTARGTRRSTLFPEPARDDPWWWWRFRFLSAVPDRLTVVVPDASGGAAFFQSDGRSPAVHLGTIPAPAPGAQATAILQLPGRLLVVIPFASGDALWSLAAGRAERIVSLGLTCLHGVLGGRGLFSTHNTPDAGLWVTDGTAAGTRRLSAAAGTRGGAIAGGRLYYGTTDALWRTDGTVRGTEQIRSGLEWPTMMGAFRDRVVFRSLRESSVWTSDGTSAGTRQIGHTFVTEPRVVPRSGAFWFVGLRDFTSSGNTSSGLPTLVRSDGTLAGTSFVRLPGDAQPTFDGGHLAAVADGVILTIDTEVAGTEAWLVDDAGSARRIAMFGPVPASGAPHELTALDGRAVLAAADAAHGVEPWVSDGTAAGTALLADLVPGAEGSSPFAFRAADGVARFLATLRGELGSVYGIPHETDGTAAGTRSLASAPPWANGVDLLGDGVLWYLVPERFDRSHAGAAIFTYADGVETRVTGPIQDGPSGGPLRVGDRVVFTVRGWSGTGGAYATRGGAPERLMAGNAWGLVSRGDVALLADLDPWDPNVWRTDGTPAGTFSLGVNGRGPVLVGDRFYFAGDDGSGHEPWVSDGTAEGTRRLADLAPGEASSAPWQFAAARSGVVFWADGGDGWALFATDGTPAGTERISDVGAGFPPPRSSPAFSPLTDGVLAFAGWDPDGGVEPWVTDGTVDGTGRVADLAPGTTSSSPDEFTRVGDRVLFAAHDAAIGRELHVLAAAAFVPGVGLPPGTREPLPPPPPGPPTSPAAPSAAPGGADGPDGAAGAPEGGGCSSGGAAAELALAWAGAALARLLRRRRAARGGAPPRGGGRAAGTHPPSPPTP